MKFGFEGDLSEDKKKGIFKWLEIFWFTMETVMSEQGAGMINSWSKIRLILKSRLGKNIFKNWIESLELVKIEKKSAFFNVPNSFIANWIDRNYRETIIETFKNEEIFIDDILFEFKNKNSLPFLMKKIFLKQEIIIYLI